jgi:kumamolisin
MTGKRFSLRGSARLGIKGATRAKRAEQPKPSKRLTVTIYVQRDPQATPAPAAHEFGRLAPHARTYLRPEQAVAAFGAAQTDLDVVVEFAERHKLKAVEQSIAKRLVRVSGTVKQLGDAFGVELRHYKHPDPDVGLYRSYEGEVRLPTELAGVVEGVLGLDNRKMVRTRPLKSARVAETAKADAQPPVNAYTPPMLAKLFDLPVGDGAGQCVAVFAFNEQSAKGGYKASELDKYFTEVLDLPTPTLTDVVVQGPGNQPGNGSERSDSTGEVLLDLCTVGGVAPGADVAVYFTEFTEEGWVNAIKAAVSDTTNKPRVISISYGNPEDDETKGAWTGQAIKLVNGAFEQAAVQGITICCASGDEGSADEPETNTPHVDFPASSPWVLGCGGIRLEANPATGKISSETVWNDLPENGATGGGVSRLFALPEWQAAADVPDNADGSKATGRGVPDVASLADPETPMWVVTPSGKLGGVGGTSAAAPMWSALITRLNQLLGTPLGFCNPQLYAHASGAGFNDIVKGDNGSYAAGPGWDPCTGWGRPDGAALLQAFKVSPAPTPVPVPSQAATSTPTPTPAPPKPSPSATPPVPGLSQNFVGPEGQLFADPSPAGDESVFQVDNTSEQYYKSPYYKLHEKQLQPVPAPRVSPPRMDLTQVVGQGRLAPCVAAKRISFHAAGDTGPSEASHIKTAASVADAMTADLATAAASGATGPMFLFHLGDVVYNFGEHQYYYDQFYEPFRAYDAPILAIPGNHDGMPEVNSEGEEGEEEKTLFAFLRNFCAAAPGPSPDSGGLVRTTMNQPGVYFTLDAPFVSIIGLYSNVLEGPGVISSEGGRYPTLDDQQLSFLIAELERLKPLREAAEGKRAVVLTCHHPPLSLDSRHGGTRGLAEDIDKACEQVGLWPDVVLSGHAHLYQRYTRKLPGLEIPYIVSGSGGHNATLPKPGAKEANPPAGYELTVDPIAEYGYLLLTVDMSTAAPTLTVVFNQTTGKSPKGDKVTVDLTTRRIL